MLRKLLGSGLDLILKNETVSRATAGIAAAGTAFYGMHCLGGHLVSGIEYAGLIGGSALSAGYLAFHSSWWHASRFLRDTGKGLGFLREKKKPAEKKGSLLWRLPLEHPIMASYLAVEGYVGGRMLADWEFWKYMKTDVAISSAGVFAGLYASLSIASHLFHPNNIGRNIPLLKAEACELIGMRKKAIKIMEGIENPAKEHSLYLASLQMKENKFGEALTAMRNGAESKNSELFHPSPMFSNLNTAREIGEVLALAEKNGFSI